MRSTITIGAIIGALAAPGAALADHPRSPGSYPRSVALTDASSAPDFLRVLKPGRSYSDLRQCGRGRYSDISAYRWNGRALAAQRRTRDGTNYWRDPRGGRVIFDGLVWRNRTVRTVLIAGWCG